MTSPNLGPFRAPVDLRRDVEIMCRLLGMTIQDYVVTAVAARLEVDRATYPAEFDSLKSLSDRREETITGK